MTSSILSIDPALISLIVFVLMLLAIAAGNMTRRKILRAEEADTKGGVNSLLAALFGLWSFVLAFTFGQSSSRFENVRAMIVDEANLLRTTIIKADFFPDSVRNIYRKELRQYLEERISYYEVAGNEVKSKENRQAISKTAIDLWAITVKQSKNPNTSSAAAGMASQLTDLFDIGIKREALLNAGIPPPIAIMLYFLAITISFVGGFTTPIIQRKEWMVITFFAFLAATILYITIDLARPMQGLIKPDTGQATIVNLRTLF